MVTLQNEKTIFFYCRSFAERFCSAFCDIFCTKRFIPTERFQLNFNKRKRFFCLKDFFSWLENNKMSNWRVVLRENACSAGCIRNLLCSDKTLNQQVFKNSANEECLNITDWISSATDALRYRLKFIEVRQRAEVVFGRVLLLVNARCFNVLYFFVRSCCEKTTFSRLNRIYWF